MMKAVSVFARVSARRAMQRTSFKTRLRRLKGAPRLLGRGRRSVSNSAAGLAMNAALVCRKRALGCCVGVSACLLASVAAAQTGNEGRFYLRTGPAQIMFDEGAEVTIAGEPVPGADARLEDNTGLAVELGYHISPRISVAATVGVPMTTTLTAAGSLAGAGELGSVKYGPGIYTVRYHFDSPGPIRPYVGAGVNWTIIFESRDGGLQNVDAKDTFGPVITAGLDIPINERMGVFAAVAKAWTSSDVTFDFPTPAGLVPGTSKVQLDPLVIYGGIQVRF